MPASTMVIHSGSDASTDLDFNFQVLGIQINEFWLPTISGKTVTFTDQMTGATLVMKGADGPLLQSDFRIIGYTLTDGSGHQLFDLDWGGTQFVLRNQTESTFTTIMHSQMADILAGSVLNLSYDGGAGADTVTGTDNRDSILGGAGKDSLAGGKSGDAILGGRGQDAVSGGGGNDTLGGEAGNDLVTGGFGADIFVFSGGYARRATGDTITDFTMAQGDRIDLQGVDGKTGNSIFDHFGFVGVAAFSGHKGELRLEVGAQDTIVQGDTNGDGTADFTIVLTGATDLDLTAFVL